MQGPAQFQQAGSLYSLSTSVTQVRLQTPTVLAEQLHNCHNHEHNKLQLQLLVNSNAILYINNIKLSLLIRINGAGVHSTPSKVPTFEMIVNRCLTVFVDSLEPYISVVKKKNQCKQSVPGCSASKTDLVWRGLGYSSVRFPGITRQLRTWPTLWPTLQTNGLNYLLYFNLVVSFHILGLLSFQTKKTAKKKSFRVVIRKTRSLGSVKYYPSFSDLGKWLAFLL